VALVLSEPLPDDAPNRACVLAAAFMVGATEGDATTLAKKAVSSKSLKNFARALIAFVTGERGDCPPARH
jgi:hypothetical protein